MVSALSTVSPRPNVLFAAFQTNRGSNGGMESATQIFEALSAQVNWTLLTNKNTARTERWRKGGARVIVQPLSDTQPRPLRALQLALWALRARQLARGADVLHSNDIRAAQALMPSAQATGLPLIHTIRDTKAPGETYGRQWSRLAQNASQVVCLSHEMAEMVGAALPEARAGNRMTTIHSIVDLARFHPATDKSALKASLGMPKSELSIGIVAGVFAKKGQREFLREVAPHLAAQHPHIHIHLVGDYAPEHDAYAQACAQTVRDANLDKHVTFHGFTDRVNDWMRACDILVVPSVREGLARCMIEAMACGVPVVSTDVCSAREMLEPIDRPHAGRVVPHGDHKAMVDALTDLITDPIARETAGQAGRAAAQQLFDISTLSTQWAALYHNAADHLKQVV